MKTRSVLVYFPGYPFEPKALSPSRLLASLAGSLLEQGHETRILDFGTVETVERLVSGKPAALAERLVDSLLADGNGNPLTALHLLWHSRAANRAFQERRTAFCAEIAHHLALQRGLHFAGIMINTVEDLLAALAIVRPLRAERPRVRIVAFGTLAEYFGEALALEMDAFDCVCVAEPETTLVALAERIDAPLTWNVIPNIVFAEGKRHHATPREPGASLSSLPAPAYEPDAYPALKAEHKIRLFDIEECRPRTAPNNAAVPGSETASRTRSVAAVCNEMWRVGTLFGGRAFHFTGEAAPASHVSAVAHEMLRRGMQAVYTRACDVSQAVPAAFPALYASGCVALSFPIDTGSQRLLDGFYAREITVTEIERAIRCSKSVGLYTIARFTYPSPADDVHTRAETLRIIERTRPDASPVSMPHVLPHSNWYYDAEHLGFGLDRTRYYQQYLRTARRFPASAAHWTPLAHRTANLSDQEVVALYRGMIREIEQRGIPAAVPEDMIRVARVAGDGGRERDLGARIQREFLRGDAMGIASLVELFNEVACVPAKRMALRGPESERMAVGN